MCYIEQDTEKPSKFYCNLNFYNIDTNKHTYWTWHYKLYNANIETFSVILC